MPYQLLERAGLIEPYLVPQAEIRDLFLHAILDPSFKPRLNRLDRIRQKRHQAVYRLAGAISEGEAKGTIGFAEEFVTLLADLI